MGTLGSAGRFKIVISDCHLSAGRFFEGSLNPHEDFFFDDEMCEFFRYFSTGEYGSGPSGPVEVELIINGDYLDFLNVPYRGEFEDAITEDIALFKVEAIIAGHLKVMAALREFAARPGKTITYVVGNHDPDLFFPKVRDRIVQEWDPEGFRNPDRKSGESTPKVRILVDQDHLSYPEGLEIHHGNQFEAVHVLNFQKPVLESPDLDQPVLNLPWGSFYVLKIINRMKWERDYVDKVRPIRLFVILGLLFDTWFTVRFGFLTAYYFIKTRFLPSPKRRSRLKVTLEIFKQESQNVFPDLENYARGILDQKPQLKTVIFGHTHRPMNRVWPDGRQYINTGTWTKMINMDWRGIGQQFRLTFAFVRIQDGEVYGDLRQWVGEHRPHVVFHG
jgi:UDP-2,3-diacylglucosamine pyrophosphatase LpxH